MPMSIIVVLRLVQIQTLSPQVLNSVLGPRPHLWSLFSVSHHFFIKLKSRWQVFSDFFFFLSFFMMWRNSHPWLQKMSLDLAPVSYKVFLVRFTLQILNCWPTQPASSLENNKPVTSALVPFQVFLLLMFHHLSPFNPKLILLLLFYY